MVDAVELVKSAQLGDVVAFNRLVLAYQELVYNVCYRTISDSEAAADATQDAFIAAFKSIKSFRGGSFKAWLLRIAVNCCYDSLRRRQRHPTQDIEEAAVDPRDGARLVDGSPGPEEQALHKELMACVEQGLALLPADQRVVVVLSDIQGLSYEEIVQATGASLGTVKSRISRARARLRDFLLEHRELLPAHLRHDFVR